MEVNVFPFWTVIIVGAVLKTLKERYVRGSHRRYVYSSVSRGVSALIVLFFLGYAIQFMVTQHPVWAVLYAACGGYNAYSLIKSRNDEDDFWSKTARKIKKRVRELRTSGTRKVVPVRN
jgi:hypothetical protein